MTGNLHAVLARVAVRGTKHTGQYFINVYDVAVMDGVRRNLREIFAEYVGKNLKRLRA